MSVKEGINKDTSFIGSLLDDNEYIVGDLVILHGNTYREGIIKYIGNTMIDEGIWYGIELIKGNGTNNGLGYFKTDGLNGIFVQNIKIKGKIILNKKSSLNIISNNSDTNNNSDINTDSEILSENDEVMELQPINNNGSIIKPQIKRASSNINVLKSNNNIKLYNNNSNNSDNIGKISKNINKKSKKNNAKLKRAQSFNVKRLKIGLSSSNMVNGNIVKCQTPKKTPKGNDSKIPIWQPITLSAPVKRKKTKKKKLSRKAGPRDVGRIDYKGTEFDEYNGFYDSNKNKLQPKGIKILQPNSVNSGINWYKSRKNRVKNLNNINKLKKKSCKSVTVKKRKTKKKNNKSKSTKNVKSKSIKYPKSVISTKEYQYTKVINGKNSTKVKGKRSSITMIKRHKTGSVGDLFSDRILKNRVKKKNKPKLRAQTPSLTNKRNTFDDIEYISHEMSVHTTNFEEHSLSIDDDNNISPLYNSSNDDNIVKLTKILNKKGYKNILSSPITPENISNNSNNINNINNNINMFNYYGNKSIQLNKIYDSFTENDNENSESNENEFSSDKSITMSFSPTNLPKIIKHDSGHYV